MRQGETRVLEGGYLLEKHILYTEMQAMQDPRYRVTAPDGYQFAGTGHLLECFDRRQRHPIRAAELAVQRRPQCAAGK